MNARATPDVRDPKSVSRGRLLPVIWLFVGIIAMVLALAIPGIGLLSAGRAYVGGEGLWSKAQKDAVIHLANYLRDRGEEDYTAYLVAISVPKGDRSARMELEKTDPDLQVAREGFLRGRNHSDDIDGMITLFRRFRNVAPIDRAIGIWARADEHLARLEAIGDQARVQVAAGTLEPRAVEGMLAELRRVNDALGPLEDEFSFTLGEVQRAMTGFLVTALLAGGGLMLLLGVAVWRRLLGQAEGAQRALRESEGQMRHLIQSAPLPLLIARRDDGRLLYGNPRSQRRFGLTGASLEGEKLATLFADVADFDRFLILTASDQATDDTEVRLQDRSGQAFWAVVSTQRIVHQGAPAHLIAVHDIDDRKRAQDTIHHRAFHDELTRLPNRAMFLDELERAVAKAKRRTSRFSVLFIDLDRFKVVNDTLGHAVGDHLLQAVADRLKAGVRQSDLVARLGGDEFVVLIEEHHDAHEIAILAAKLLERMQHPYMVDHHEIVLTGSIGISTYPENGSDRDALVKNADLAMYQAKDCGRNNFQFFTATAAPVQTPRQEIETRLRGALERGEFVLHYQPVVVLATGEMRGVEALLRWNDPATGMRPPGTFIPLAEETGIIIAIGRWILQTACGQLREWHDQGRKNLRMAVNVSARQFEHGGLVEEVSNALREAQLEAHSLELEVTESSVLGDHANVEPQLERLRALGVGISLDDFGTGYSSLSLLKRLPLTCVKIDRSFVADCTKESSSLAIVQAVVAMARSLHHTVVAEGVETDAQRNALAMSGCTLGQGYLFSRPIPAHEVLEVAQRIKS